MSLLTMKKTVMAAIVAVLACGMVYAADNAPADGKKDQAGRQQRPDRDNRAGRTPQTPLGKLMREVKEKLEKDKLNGAKVELEEDMQFYKTLQGKTAEQMATAIQDYIKKQKEKSEQLAAIELAQATEMINKSELADEQKAIAFVQTWGKVYNDMNTKTTYVQIKMAEFFASLKDLDRDTRREALHGFFEEIQELGGMDDMRGMGMMMRGNMRGGGRPGGDRADRGGRPGQENNNQPPKKQDDREMF